MNEMLTRLGHSRLVAVVTVDRAEDALPLAEALAVAGLQFVEVTLRTPAALAALRMFASQPGMCAGVGSVLRPDQVTSAVAAGARYLVSPGFSRGIVERCQAEGVIAIPGAATATEVMTAIDAGVEVLKFFPAESLGGPRTLQALAGPFPAIRWIPTGGITAANLANYVKAPPVLAVGGSWMVSPSLISAGRWDTIRELAAEAVRLATTGDQA